MKICILNEGFGIGGLERVTSVVGESLSNYYDVFFYSMFSSENFYNIENNFIVGSDVSKKRNKYLNPNNYLKKTSYLLNKKIIPSKYHQKEVSALCKWIRSQEINVLIISSPILISFIPDITKKSNVKCIAWLHNNYDVYMDDYTKKFNEAFVNGLESANAAVCLTQYDLERYRIHNKNTKCIYNPLTIEHKENDLADLSKKNIAFTGRIAFDHKGIDYLIEVAKSLPLDWTITMAGDGTAEQKQKLLSLISENSLEKTVIFKGPLKGETLNEHYRNASIYLMTSRWEGMPLVLAEAMSFGLPIIAFSQSGSNEVLENGKYGVLVKNGDILEMNMRLNDLISDIEQREELSKKSLERVNSFDLDKITHQWRHLLESLESDSIGE